jgi:hypothetical protein
MVSFRPFVIKRERLLTYFCTTSRLDFFGLNILRVFSESGKILQFNILGRMKSS